MKNKCRRILNELLYMYVVLEDEKSIKKIIRFINCYCGIKQEINASDKKLVNCIMNERSIEVPTYCGYMTAFEGNYIVVDEFERLEIYTKKDFMDNFIREME